ncbi:DUF1853 family protein [Undibacterium sp. Ji49W]|uniref:DUF1853 family protein n=1 Tax=Undibacterium sp. Ji49W TaxID=3413040 RepID=UPI003BF3BD68
MSRRQNVDACQADFHQQWQHLHNPHVRALAWMLTAPGLLDAQSPLWHAAIARPPVSDVAALRPWLQALDHDPAALLTLLGRHAHRRLGLYAETLFEFYLQAHGLLHAHGLQVNNKGANTIGEFDFLLQRDGSLQHLELATKFYLFHRTELAVAAGEPAVLYDFLGPNLADSLGAKISKIIDQQLQLSRHPLAQPLLPQAVSAAQALVLGWLFYREQDLPLQLSDLPGLPGLNASHCLGLIWTQEDLQSLDIDQALILDRLDWLAPAQALPGQTQGNAQVMAAIAASFDVTGTPVMLALMQENEGLMQEYRRGMVVPADWFMRAAEIKRT